MKGILVTQFMTWSNLTQYWFSYIFELSCDFSDIAIKKTVSVHNTQK